MARDLNGRIVSCAGAWGVAIERVVPTQTSMIVYGKRAAAPVVLKVVKEEGDEWRCGEIAAKFGGRGVVQVYEHTPGAALFEKLDPGEPLAALTLAGRDDEATDILAMLLGRMSPGDPPDGLPDRRAVGRGVRAPRRVAATSACRRRSSTPRSASIRIFAGRSAIPALLHGDLHHYNVLSDRARGWCAIDPKGVVGELEYELGAALRNPIDRPDLFASLDVVERRLDHFGLALGIDTSRARGWCFAQAVLAGDLERRGWRRRCRARRGARGGARAARFERSESRLPRLRFREGGAKYDKGCQGWPCNMLNLRHSTTV